MLHTGGDDLLEFAQDNAHQGDTDHPYEPDDSDYHPDAGEDADYPG